MLASGLRRFWLVCGLALPLANVALAFGIRYSGGAHNHGYLIAGAVAVIEAAAIAACAWFFARRHAVVWTPLGFLVNFAVSATVIYAVIFISLAIAYASGGAT